MHCCFSPISFSALLEYKTKITVRKKAMQSKSANEDDDCIQRNLPKTESHGKFWKRDSYAKHMLKAI